MDQFVTRGPLYPERVEKTSANCNGWGEIWEPEGCAVQSWSYVETFTPENSSESCLSLVLRFFFFPSPFIPSLPFFPRSISLEDIRRYFGGGDFETDRKVEIEELGGKKDGRRGNFLAFLDLFATRYYVRREGMKNKC